MKPFFRDHKASMIRLRKLLSDASKEGRHRRKILNVLITFFAWLVESIGFLVIFLGTFILDHENNFFNYFMQTLTLVIYFNILPYVFMMNEPDLKSSIIDSKLYGTILKIFHCNYVKQIDNDEESSNAENISEEENVGGNNNNSAVVEGDNYNHNDRIFQRSTTTSKEFNKENTSKNKGNNENNNTSQDSSLPASDDVTITDLE